MSQDSLFFGADPDPSDEDPTIRDSAEALAARARTLEELRTLAAGCQGCDLYRDATQTVFGEGPAEDEGKRPDARLVELVFVGEQPGDQEDLQGRPFVGPAGRVLDRGLRDAGIARERTYVTNAVKHFKWQPRDVKGPGFRGTGKRRIHATPNREEVAACRPWLDSELALLKPELVVLLGATAAKALLGPSFRVTRQRGQVLAGPNGYRCMATVHPSSILRGDPARKDAAYADFVDDLRAAAAELSA